MIGVASRWVAVRATGSRRQCGCRTSATADATAASVGNRFRDAACFHTRETASADASSAPPVRSRQVSNIPSTS